MVQNAGALRVFRNANGEGVVIQQGGAAVRVMLPIQPAPAAGGRPLAEAERASPNHPPAVEPPKELAMLLELLVEDAALAAGLSEAERETLVLAGKLDINRYRADRETELRERFEHADEAPGNEKPRVQTETAAAWNPFADANSRFRKAARQPAFRSTTPAADGSRAKTPRAPARGGRASRSCANSTNVRG